MHPPTLNIVGCGRLGRSLGRLFHRAGAARILDLLSTREASAAEAQAFIGAGRPVAGLAELRDAELWLIATPDSAIAGVAAALAAAGRPAAGVIVFHCSGARSSALLAPLAARGAAIASAHPVLSFASPEAACEHFPGSHLGLEGSQGACAVLRGLFEQIGARCFAISAEHKLLYHAASVFASNFTVVLLDVALRAYREAGLDEDTAARVMRPLVEGAVGNALRLGPAAALSGPAARGELATLRDQQRCVEQWSADGGEAYAVLTRLAIDLARRR